MNTSISEFGHFFCCEQAFQSKINNIMANSVDPDETARYEPALFAKVIMLFCNVLQC